MKVLRYEIKNIQPPHDMLAAMEKQMRAEREKRAVILTSEGQRDAAINTAEGEKQQVIKASEATRQQQINEAEGQAQAILAVATATAEGIRRVAEAIRTDGGMEAVQLRVAEQYVAQFGNLAKQDEHRSSCPASVRRRRHDCRGDEGVRICACAGRSGPRSQPASTLTVPELSRSVERLEEVGGPRTGRRSAPASIHPLAHSGSGSPPTRGHC